MPEKWSPTIENKRKITIEDAKFIFEQAEKQMKEVSDASQIIIARTTTFISIIAGLTIGIFGFAVQRWDNNQSIDAILLTAIIAMAYLFLICCMLMINLRPEVYHSIGREPRNLFDDKYFVETIAPKYRIIRFYVSEIETYQEKISNNKSRNEKKWERFNNVIMLIIGLIPYLIIIYFTLYRMYSITAAC